MPSDDEPVDEGKRNFLKVMVAVSVIAAAGGAVKAVLQNVKTPVAGITSFPTMQLYWVPPNSTSSIPVPLKTADFPTNSPSIFVFDYPLQGEPNFLLKLADASGKPIKIESTEVTIPATGAKFMSAPGVGPDQNIVASSAICEHLGCVPPIIHYYTPGTPIPGHPGLVNTYKNGLIHCNCHGSTYDPLHGFAVVTGPTAKPLPNVVLEWDPVSDTLYVKSMVGPTIYGKPSDLSGGTPFPVGTTTTTVTDLGTPSS